MPLKWKSGSPVSWKFPVPVLKTSRSSPLSPAYISLVEDDDAHMKVALGYGEMGIPAHLQASKTGNTRFFTSNTHSSVVLQGFDQLRIEGLLCDVTLVAGDGDEAFPVHRAMMASSSDYFKAMFTGGCAKPFL
ncbi:kelch-like [Ataeniobius toweri]|uniref:Kelch-like n=1 Tax=Ataeniobius toweri TaxID=208326 RepID=A0ABU7C910_9TELE|nr:kelch-like [Ataeniobius toweri]